MGPDWGQKCGEGEAKGEVKCSDGSIKEMQINVPRGLAAILQDDPVHLMDKIPIRKTPKDQWHLATYEEKKGSWLNALMRLNNTGKFFIFSFNAFFLFLAMVHSSNQMETNKYCSKSMHNVVFNRENFL